MADREEPPPAHGTFGAVLPQALAVKGLEWSPGSRARFEGVAQHYVSHWNAHRFADIDRGAVLAWLSDLRAAGIQPATQIKALAVFRAVWAEAHRSGLGVGADPSADMPIKKPVYRMGRALNEPELTRLVAAATDDQTRAQLLVAAVMGLRWGEIAGLAVGDVDLDLGVVHVRASLARGRAHGADRYELKAPKTRSSIRAVPVPEVMTGIIRRCLMGTDDRPRPTGPAFLTPDGGQLTYHRSRRLLIRTASAANVADCTGWHVLRRTAATLALQAGLTLKDVQAMLGHSTPSQTLAAYVAARDSLALAAPLDKLARHALDLPDPTPPT